MATILERRHKIQKEQRRFIRKLRSLQEECPHPKDRVSITRAGFGFIAVCQDCLKEEVHEHNDTET